MNSWYYAKQVVDWTVREPKGWEMDGRSGVMHAADVAVVSRSGTATIVVKAKTAEDLNRRLGLLVKGKGALLPVHAIPFFEPRDRRPAGYRYELAGPPAVLEAKVLEEIEKGFARGFSAVPGLKVVA